jgi:hypothetical protein
MTSGKDPHLGDGAHPRLRSALAVGVMWAALLQVYLPWDVLLGRAFLVGLDYAHLHQHRLAFAREELWKSGALPAWYPRELLGTPFWANIQNFPFVPTRLFLLWVNPDGAYLVGVLLAALSSALFTFLFCRSLSVGRLGSAGAGFTFAAAGFFASRVTAGHLPLLEAYPALPLLLWTCEEYRRSRRVRWLWAIAGAMLAMALCGHPQLPVYAVLTAVMYVTVMSGRGALKPLSAISLGAGMSLFAWVPMLLLVGRSTRVLMLDPPENDIALPARRLLGFVLPWLDGWPSVLLRKPWVPFSGYPSYEYFWDTVVYVGLLPLLALLALATARAWQRQRPSRPFAFLALAGAVALLLALPALRPSLGPGIFLRSPARQLYVTTFALSVCFGAGVDVLSTLAVLRRTRIGLVLVVTAVLAVQGWDLGTFARAFVRTEQPWPEFIVPLRSALQSEVGNGRAAVELGFPFSRTVDNVGFFDSVILARPYRAILDLAGATEGLNIQRMDGTDLPSGVLQSAGVRAVVTLRSREDLERIVVVHGMILYRVVGALPRASVIPAAGIRRLEEKALREELQKRRALRPDELLLAAEAPSDNDRGGTEGGEVLAERRETPDRLSFIVSAAPGAYLRILESWDPGWTATLDGVPARILLADGFAMAVRLSGGTHRVELTYRTPGALLGLTLSLGSLTALLAWFVIERRRAGADRAPA